MTQKAARKRELRAAVERLPLATRQAMLEGIETATIVVGGDGDMRGGVCPIYATANPPSKRIGRPFARAWDRYAGARLTRPASERELSTLRSMLATSVEGATENEPPDVSLRAAITSHEASRARSRAAATARAAAADGAAAPAGDAAPADVKTAIDAELAGGLARDRDRSTELSRRAGWAWLRPFRSYDDYERALRQLEEIAPEAAPAATPERLPTHV